MAGEARRGSGFFSSLILFVGFFLALSGVCAAGGIESSDSLDLPAPGTFVGLSPVYHPVLLRGVRVHPEDPFRFDFIIDKGDTAVGQEGLKTEVLRQIKYFLTALTIPQKDLWVNLSPWEADRVVPGIFGLTEMGRNLLAQDYLLKQVAASTLHPDRSLGRRFWDEVYRRAYDAYGTTRVPVNTMSKLWVVPRRAEVFVSGRTALIVGADLKVMEEEDYRRIYRGRPGRVPEGGDRGTLSSEVMRRVILPAVEKEVNEGGGFAPLRQIYHAVLLASWFRDNVHETVLSRVYVSHSRIKGLESGDRKAKEKIFERYLESLRRGAVSILREDRDLVTGKVVPRKYFAGGMYFVEAKLHPLREEEARRRFKPFAGSAFLVESRLNPETEAASSSVGHDPFVGENRLMRGRIFDREFVDRERRRKDKTIAFDLNHTLVAFDREGNRYRLRPGIELQLERLRQRGFRLVLWTTTSRKALMDRGFFKDLPSLAGLFDLIITQENFVAPTKEEIKHAYHGIVPERKILRFYKRTESIQTARKDITLLGYSLLVDDAGAPDILRLHPLHEAFRIFRITGFSHGENVFSSVQDYLESIGLSENFSYEESTRTRPGILESFDVDDTMLGSVGAKAMRLAGFEKFLQKKGIAIHIPRWAVIPTYIVAGLRRSPDEFEHMRKDLRSALEWIGGGLLGYGDKDHPLLVSVRASNPRVREGYYVTLLDVGINDETLPAVAASIRDEAAAKRMYGKLIRDFAIDVHGIDPGRFDEELKRRRPGAVDTDTVAEAKEVYHRLVGEAFPQDPYEQLRQAIFSVTAVRRAGHARLAEEELNAVIIQRMRYGNLARSFSGAVISRDPLTGRHGRYGTAREAAFGDEAGDALGLQNVEREYPDLLEELEVLAREAEAYMGDLAVLEFTIERSPRAKSPELFILQVRRYPSTKMARVKLLHDFLEEGLWTGDEVVEELAQMDLNSLKLGAFTKLPRHTVRIGSGYVANEGIAVGVAVGDLKTARALRREGLPVIIVKPIITAIDDELIRNKAEGAIAVEEFGWHLQAIAIKSGIPAVAGVSHFRFDEEKEKIFFRVDGEERELKYGETVLAIDRKGGVYLYKGPREDLKKGHLRKRKTYLEPELVDALIWKAESEGYKPIVVVDEQNWRGKRERHKEISAAVYTTSLYKKSSRSTGSWSKARFFGVRDVKRGRKIQRPEKERREIPEDVLPALVARVTKEKSNPEAFSFFLWETYDKFSALAAEQEGLTGDLVRNIDFVNLGEMRKRFVRRVAEEAPDAFVRSVFHGVDRHKMAQFIFRASITDAFDREFAGRFFIKVLDYGIRYGYSGDVRGRDYQVARLFAHFVKLSKPFALDVLLRMTPPQQEFLLEELYQFYIVFSMHTKAFDSDFADYRLMSDFLREAASRDSNFADRSSRLLGAIDQRLSRIEGKDGSASSPLTEIPGGVDFTPTALAVASDGTLSVPKGHGGLRIDRLGGLRPEVFRMTPTEDVFQWIESGRK